MVPVLHSRPWITPADQAAVAAVLEGRMLGQGALARRLEQRLAGWVGAAEAVAVGSATAALVLALRGLGVGPGHEVILPTYVCVSVLEAVLSCGATPVLCDVGDDWVVRAADAARHLGPRTRAVIVPHQYGVFAEVGAFRALGVPIIEDCAQALGAAGSRPLEADVAVLSLHPTKCLTAGEGGLAAARDPALAEVLRRLRDGSREAPCARVPAPLSDLAAALALSQLDRYPEGLERRRRLAARYAAALEVAAPACLRRPAMARSMFFRFPVAPAGGLEGCQAAFLARGVQVRRGVDLLLHRAMGLDDRLFPVAVAHFASTVSLPIHPALTPAEEDRCVEAAAAVLAS
ncbi:MAG: DegT/DnrJ/EryC1/StrS family aminotransferase [Anaeromyxobacter sp.]|nr:DegT/DnrJ/EryC1/StrS family aminotransferase [Anaeromyxobacter sp.]